jgi:hypothetical protein
VLEVPRDEVQCQKLVYPGASLVAGERPYVVGEDSDGPVFRLNEQDNRRSRAPFALAERSVGGGREQEGRPDTPRSVCRDEQGTGRMSGSDHRVRWLLPPAQSLSPGTRRLRWLHDHSSGNQIPGSADTRQV